MHRKRYLCLKKGAEKIVFPPKRKTYLTYWRTDIYYYRVASLLKIKGEDNLVSLGVILLFLFSKQKCFNLGLEGAKLLMTSLGHSFVYFYKLNAHSISETIYIHIITISYLLHSHHVTNPRIRVSLGRLNAKIKYYPNK